MVIPEQKERPQHTSIYNHIKLSFRDGYSTDVIGVLNDSIQKRRWEWNVQQVGVQAPITRRAPQVPNIKLRTGIVGIERSIQEKQKETDASISLAFQDLSKLMTMAKDMVKLSQNISTKIRVI